MKNIICFILILSIVINGSGGITNHSEASPRSIPLVDLQQEISTSIPQITYPSLVSQRNWLEITGTWKTSDDDPIWNGELTASLYINSSIIGKLREDITSTNTYGNFTLDIYSADLLPGNYIWELNFRKSGYQSWDITIDVEVVSPSYLIEIDSEPELIRGEDFTITAMVEYDDPNSDFNGNRAAGVGIRFTFTMLTINGGQVTMSKFQTSDFFGMVTVILTGEETAGIEEIISITAQVNGDETEVVVVDEPNLPIMMDPPSVDEPMLDRITTFLQDNVIPHLVLTLLLIITSSVSGVLLMKKRVTHQNPEMWPKHQS